MRINKCFLIATVMILICIMLTGCWNYREVENLAIVAGVAIDKLADESILITVEVVDISADGKVAYEPVHLEVSGKTFFDAARRAITLEGKKLYWSHAKVAIICQEIAKEDVTKYMDFLFRDAETREDMWILISKEKTAGEILRSKPQIKSIVSFQIDDTMRAQKSLSRFPRVELFEYFDRLFYRQVAPVLPTISLTKQDGEDVPQIEGSAVFIHKKMVGLLSADDTKAMLWLRDEVEGGIAVIEDVEGDTDVSLEIYDSKTKITPIIDESGITMKADIELDVSVGEITGADDFISAEGEKKLIDIASKHLEKEIMDMYLKVRDEYKADIFGFGRRIEMKIPQVWKIIKDDWEELFTEVKLDLRIDIHIRGSATTRTPLKVGN